MPYDSDIKESLRDPFPPEEDDNMILRQPSPWLSGLAAVLTSMLSGCVPAPPPLAETPPPPVTVSKPIVRKVVDQDDYEGRVVAGQKVEIRARVRGHLIEIKFQAGDMVKKDDLLYEIDPRPAKASLDAAKAQEKSAEASLQFAKAEYNRERALLPKGGSSREEVELRAAKQAVANGELLKAKAAVEQAQLDLDFTKITAPLDGKLSKTMVDVGNLVNAGGGETLLTTLVTVDPMYVEFKVDERSLRRYMESHRKAIKEKGPQPSLKEQKIPVYVALEGDEGYPHEGVIDFADNKVDPGTGTNLVRGILSNAERIFEDGMRARVRIPVSDPHKVTVVIERAIGNDQGKKFLYVVNAQNTVERRDVTLGRLRDGLQEIPQGVQPDEWIIVNGIQRVRDGMKVEPRRVPMPGAKQSNEPTPEKPIQK
jgi:RND family efflux transporter MFP subunit